ncbi:MAG TPA: ABC transporter permease [Stellaceae bacterium]|nr:ABC transporter permease [Stellaceae bacterium]
MATIVIQLLNGLAGASALFLVAAGLSVVFGVSRMVNFAHGSLAMLGAFIAATAVARIGGGLPGYVLAVLLAGLAVGLLGIVIEIVLLRRIYRSPELFQLLATFGLVLVIGDLALRIWGPEDILGPRVPGLSSAIQVMGRSFPEYDLVLIGVGPVVLGLLWLLFNRTRWGVLVRAATLDREMVDLLGVSQGWLFTSVFFLGAFLAGLGGAIQLPREGANLNLDIAIITDAFVVVVVGGMGSITGAYLAALLIGILKAIAISVGEVHVFGLVGSLSRVILVLEFLVMATVLVIRPHGLLGRADTASRAAGGGVVPMGEWRPPILWRRLGLAALAVILLALPLLLPAYWLVVAIEVILFALFAASLHFILGPGGLVSFGHAAFFGIGAYGAALVVRHWGWPMLAAIPAGIAAATIAAVLVGWFVVRLTGVYLAMLTMAFAQIAWSVVFQWDTLTGGDNGLIGIWPASWAADRRVFYLLALCLCALGVLGLRRVLAAPFGMALRAARDSSLRAEAIGIDVRRVHWLAFSLAGLTAGLAGALYAFYKGNVTPASTLSIPISVDGLVMVLLGGVGVASGPLVGAGVFVILRDELARFDFWRLILGGTIMLMVLAFPEGIAGFVQRVVARSLKGLAERH